MRTLHQKPGMYDSQTGDGSHLIAYFLGGMSGLAVGLAIGVVIGLAL